MGSIKHLFSKTIFIDSAPFIYFIEKHSQYHNQLFEIFEANDNGDIFFQTSSLTLQEVLVQPFRLKRNKLARQYEQILTTSPNIHIYNIDIEVARRAAKLRAIHNLKTPDAIQLATALEKSADIFFTNDLNLKKVSEIEVMTLMDI